MNRSELLGHLNTDLLNERGHLAAYLYFASAVAGPHALKYRSFFEEAAKQEMRHVLAFQDRILWLNGYVSTQPPTVAPRLLVNARDPAAALQAAIELEFEVIENYASRIAQLEVPPVPELCQLSRADALAVRLFYEEQLQDSYEDYRRMQRLQLELPA